MTTAHLVIREIRSHPLHIAYPRTLRWADHAESGSDYLILEIITEDGCSGIAEGTVKVNWNGTTLRSLALSFEEIFAPRLIGVDAGDEGLIRKILKRIPENRLAKSLIDIACWDLRAQALGKPLWRVWNGDPTVPVSWTVTRQKPADMAHEAAERVAAHGFQMLKIKTGQGLETDFRAVEEIRRAVGDDMPLYADSNGAYAQNEVRDYAAGLKDRGVFLAEDPCKFCPDCSFEALRKSCPLPIMVDNDCSSPFEASAFLDRGAEAISIKIQKSGFTGSWEIVQMAAERGAKTHVGILGESSLGSLAALQLAATLPDRRRWLPAETSFFLSLPQEFVHAPLVISNGAITLPDEPSFARLVDWNRVKALCP